MAKSRKVRSTFRRGRAAKQARSFKRPAAKRGGTRS